MPESVQSFDVGSAVIFKGFASKDIPPNGDLLQKGDEYIVGKVDPETEENEATYQLEVPNPSYDSNKRNSKSNMPTIMVDCFAEELEASEEESEEEVETLEWGAVKKGDQLLIVENNEEGTEWEGTVTKKTKASLTLATEDSDVVFKADEIYSMNYSESEEQEPEEEIEEEVEEETKPATKKKSTKKKATPKAKPKAKAKAEESEEEEEESSVDTSKLDIKGLIILSDEEDDQEIVEMYEGTEDPVGLVQEVAEAQALTEYQLGGLIYHLRVSGDYLDMDERYGAKKGFELFCDEQLNVGYRKAMYLSDIYSKWNKYGLDRSLITRVGWTKAMVAASNMTEENADDLVELIEDKANTVEDIQATIKENYSKVGAVTSGGEMIRRKTFKFRIEEDAADAVENYMEMAAQHFETTDLNQVFQSVLTDWANSTLDMAAIKKNLRKVKTRNKAATEEQEPVEEKPQATKKKAVSKKTAKKAVPTKKVSPKRR